MYEIITVYQVQDVQQIANTHNVHALISNEYLSIRSTAIRWHREWRAERRYDLAQSQMFSSSCHNSETHA